jgi:alanine racemase
VTQGARALILPAALSHNLEVIRRRAPGCRVMAAVKGNAYGHGLVTAARQFAAADSLAVARLVEAARLRDAGISAPLVLLPGPSSLDELRTAVDLDCEIVVHCAAQLPLLDDPLARGRVVWLKVDSGMHRLGFDPADVAGVITRLQTSGRIGDLRLMTHFASADEPSKPQAAQQLTTFRKLCAGFRGAVSAANSAALFALDGAARDRSFWGHDGETWVRPGVALYGISPFAESSGADLGLQPAMRFVSRLIAVKPIRAGEPVGYGGRWVASRDTRLGIIAAGYADGYTRFLPSGTPVLVNGRRVPLAGIVSMDLATVDLGPESSDRAGDEVLLWGPALPVEDVARSAGTIPYQLVTGVMHREPASVG